jgi:hypothetical protein
MVESGCIKDHKYHSMDSMMYIDGKLEIMDCLDDILTYASNKMTKGMKNNCLCLTISYKDLFS